MKRAIIIGLAALTLSACGDSPDEMQRFRQACTDRGGFLAETEYAGWFIDWVECVKNNQVIYLPGFA